MSYGMPNNVFGGANNSSKQFGTHTNVPTWQVWENRVVL